eukprot:12889426-Alexandrium_andersonii.AAC.2
MAMRGSQARPQWDAPELGKYAVHRAGFLFGALDRNWHPADPFSKIATKRKGRAFAAVAGAPHSNDMARPVLCQRLKAAVKQSCIVQPSYGIAERCRGCYEL